MPDVTVPQHDGFNNTGIFDFTYKLECDKNFAGVCMICKLIDTMTVLLRVASL